MFERRNWQSRLVKISIQSTTVFDYVEDFSLENESLNVKRVRRKTGELDNSPVRFTFPKEEALIKIYLALTALVEVIEERDCSHNLGFDKGLTITLDKERLLAPNIALDILKRDITITPIEQNGYFLELFLKK